jgi:regulator of nucleoside diphosphate kinase
MKICYISFGDHFRRALSSRAKGLKTIFITSEDYLEIKAIIAMLPKARVELAELQRELERAVVVEAWEIPPRVVTINSRVRLLDLDNSKTEEWILSMPEQADPDQRRLSVLAPVGTAILGFSEGDVIEWETPGGTRRLKLEKVEEVAESELGVAV